MPWHMATLIVAAFVLMQIQSSTPAALGQAVRLSPVQHSEVLPQPAVCCVQLTVLHHSGPAVTKRPAGLGTV